ncbi:MAG: Nucleolar protein 16 [Claussenomyces sp. TS43310]|nr:MAG: Nucleolar protein 16 [Claussenomyces sp. TS43310]
MGRELQKKKNRSSVSKVKQKPKSKKIVNPRGNAIIAANWDSKQTLTQNYRRLGLASRLNAATGGIEKQAAGASKASSSSSSSRSATADKLSIHNATPTTIVPAEARVERDAATGKIVRVIHSAASRHRSNPLNDALNSEDEDDDAFEGFDEDGHGHLEGRGIVPELERQAMMEAPKRPRKQSAREQEWVQALVQRYGDDTGRMFRDRRLNPMQQTEADIRRRIDKWRADGDGDAAAAAAAVAAAGEVV